MDDAAADFVLRSARMFSLKTQTGRDGHDPFCALRSGFLFLLDLDDLSAIVETAIGANSMRQAHGTAVRAGDEVARQQGVLRAAAIAAALRMFALWMWGHVFLLIT